MKKTRKENAGIALADAIFELCNMMYNVNTASGFLTACVKRLNIRSKELKPKKASPEYKKARYGNSGIKPPKIDTPVCRR